MEIDDKLRILNEAYSTAVTAGIASTWKEFADFVGIHRTGMSAAKNGDPRFLTDNFIVKVQAKMNTLKAQAPAEPSEAPGIFLPGSTLKLYEAIVESNKELSSTVKTQQDTIRMLVEIIREDNGVKKGPSADLPRDMIRDTP